ncbi:MAG: ABC transporter ATP-binding protein [Verrucomicrobia bacterium]|nr:ABC transporter ATP-binding protein [Verrucomicrobiota bacterium]
MAETSPTPARFRPRNLLGVLAFLGRYRARVALCLALLLVNITIEMALPQLLGNAITGLRDHVERATPFEPMDFVWLFLALVTLRALVGFILGPIRNRTVQRTLGDIRSAVYNALQRLAFTYHDKSNTGELISRATTDVSRLQDFLFACLLLTVDIAVALVVTVWLIFHISPALGWVAIGTMLPTVALIGFYASKLQPQWRAVHDLHGAMTTVIQENIAGVRVVKAFAKENAEVAKFRERKETYLGTLLKTVNYWAARVPFAQFIYGLSTPLALWIGGRAVIQGELPIGDLAKVVLYLMAIGYRVGMVGQFTNIVQNASASAERVLEIIHEPSGLASGKEPMPPGRGHVTFENVGFTYSTERDGGRTSGVVGQAPPPVKVRQAPSPAETAGEGARSTKTGEGAGSTAKAALADLTFEAKPGQTIAIVGPTGSGKTTLVNLIPRFYDATQGRVLLDGVNVRELDLRALRQSVGVIFQETFLFSASAAENIAYGRPTATREEIIRCAQAAQAHGFITELEDGYDTIIGERGVSLSGGQRQRIAIARAFLMDPRILILDDATASVDAGTERQIQEAMRKLCEGRTAFIIAQRFSTVQHADMILVLKEGRIVERGTHAELIQRSGFYREVFEKQIQH